MPSDPVLAIAYVDRFLIFCVNLRNLTAEDGDSSIAGRNHHIGIIIKSAELVFPISKQTRDYQLNSMASVVRSWSRESHFLEHNLAVFLLSDHLNDLNHLLSQNTRSAQIEIPMPGGEGLVDVFSYFEETYPKALSNFAGEPQVPSERLAGATVSSMESLLRMREYDGRPLEQSDLSDLKKSLVERDSYGLIEFVEPTRSLDDVYGHGQIKEWMRQDIDLWKQGDLEAMPMGYLLCGCLLYTSPSPRDRG